MENVEYNKQLIEKYSWLYPHYQWTGEKVEDYDYTWTELDALSEGWRKAFGELLCEEIQEELEKNPGATPMIFLLSDGETNVGNKLKNCIPILQYYSIPVYTIGYNANIEALEEISSINEAVSINADSDDVIYKIKSLFNAQM